MTYNGYGYIGFPTSGKGVPMRIEAHTAYGNVVDDVGNVIEVLPCVIITWRKLGIEKPVLDKIYTPRTVACENGREAECLLAHAAKVVDATTAKWEGYRLERLGDFEKKSRAISRRRRGRQTGTRRSPVLS
ncbi:hypothetical protein [Hyphomicrobium sp.]|uniref:hypothetical protein n=1 Tax=Hyphomicrobium sp. TaxID=82 RepID=UPI001D234D17|nr:hypothetical protein [Hyphomicrobium sp.]MBY0561512.1 hypothetical protein [Hyphomicrobium sp.]